LIGNRCADGEFNYLVSRWPAETSVDASASCTDNSRLDHVYLNGGKKESVDRRCRGVSGVIGPICLSTQNSDTQHSWCRDMSGVIGPLADGAEMRGNGAIADGELRTLVARFPRRLHYCTNAGILLENCHFSPLLGTLGAPSTRDGLLRYSFRSQQIGTDMSASGR
jgi:hypothetical protein